VLVPDDTRSRPRSSLPAAEGGDGTGDPPPAHPRGSAAAGELEVRALLRRCPVLLPPDVPFVLMTIMICFFFFFFSFLLSSVVPVPLISNSRREHNTRCVVVARRQRPPLLSTRRDQRVVTEQFDVPWPLSLNSDVVSCVATTYEVCFGSDANARRRKRRRRSSLSNNRPHAPRSQMRMLLNMFCTTTRVLLYVSSGNGHATILLALAS